MDFATCALLNKVMLEMNYMGRSFEANQKVIDASALLWFSIETILNAESYTGILFIIIVKELQISYLSNWCVRYISKIIEISCFFLQIIVNPSVESANFIVFAFAHKNMLKATEKRIFQVKYFAILRDDIWYHMKV